MTDEEQKKLNLVCQDIADLADILHTAIHGLADLKKRLDEVSTRLAWMPKYPEPELDVRVN